MVARSYNARRGSSTDQGYGSPWQALRAQIIRERGAICEIDGEGPREDDGLDLDHRVARAKGGTDDPTNLRLVHHSEHSRKTVLVDHGLGRR